MKRITIIKQNEFIVKKEFRYRANVKSSNYEYYRFVLKKKIWIFNITIVSSEWIPTKIEDTKLYNKFNNLIKCINSAREY